MVISMGILTGIGDAAVSMLGSNFTNSGWLGKTGAVSAGILGAGIGIAGVSRISDSLTRKRGDDGKTHPIGNMIGGAAILGAGAGAVLGGAALAGRFGGKYVQSMVNAAGITGSAIMGTAAAGGALLGGRLMFDGIAGRKRDDGSKAGWGSAVMGTALLAGSGIGLGMMARNSVLSNDRMRSHIINANNNIAGKAREMSGWWKNTAWPATRDVIV